MSKRPSLGISKLDKNEFSSGATDKLRHFVFLVVAILVVGVVFYYLTGAVQSSTAHATSDDSALHY